MAVLFKPGAVKWSELKGRPVVDLASAKRVGSLDDLLLDGQNQAILGLRFKPGLFSADHSLGLASVTAIGRDAITVRLEGETADAPQEQVLKKLPTLTGLLNRGIVTESGKYVGAVSDIALNLEPLQIVGIEASEGGIFAKKHLLEVNNEVRYGEKLLVIPDRLADTVIPPTTQTGQDQPSL